MQNVLQLMALTVGLGGVDGAAGAVCASVKTVSRAKMSARLFGILRRKEKKTTCHSINIADVSE